MTDRERKGVPEHRSYVLRGSLPQGPPAHSFNLLTLLCGHPEQSSSVSFKMESAIVLLPDIGTKTR